MTSTTSSASGSPSMKSVMREYARLLCACLIIMLPMSSTAAGSISSVATVASIDSIRSSKWMTDSALNFGFSTSFSFASVMVTSVPSEPTTNRAILKSLPPTNSSKL